MSKPKPDASAIRRLLVLTVGAILVLAGVGLAALTERGLIDFRASAERHGGQVLDLGGAGPQAGQSGYMVRVAGPLQVVEAPLDEQFNQQVPAPLLIRHVEMFEWHELRLGGPASYELDWEDHPIDSSHFEQPRGHANPAKFPIEGAQYDAGEVRVGGFVLSPTLVNALPGSAPVAPDMRRLPGNLAASFSLYQDHLVTSVNPANPQLGDLRVSWEQVPLQTVTIVAKADGDRLVPAGHAADGKGYDVEVGQRSLADVFPDLSLPPGFVWPRRLLAVLLAALGVSLLLWHEGERIDLLLALATGALVVGAVPGVLWLGSDNGIAVAWIVLAVLGAALAYWRLHVRQRED
jgi:hypothetical protein